MANILVVDDEKSIRNTFQAFLSNEGHSVQTAENVDNAIQLLAKTDFDLVLTDVIMPHITGMELLDHITASSPDIPVIIMTGEPTIETAKQAVRNSAFDYLTKPINKDSLLKTVRNALNLKSISDNHKKLEIENQQYRDNLEKLVAKRTQALQKTMSATIHTISSMLELRDVYTAQHQRRVANLAVAIAGKMGLKKSQIECLYVTGYVHDIGKLVVPAEILSKPGTLSDLEFEFVKTHVECGYNLLKNVDLPWPISDVLHQHHERMNGSGYPQGLEGSDIDICARVLAVADVVEAMSSHRPYRPSRGLDAALSEIEKGSGEIYDPDVAAAVLALFREDGYQIEETAKEIIFEI